MLGVIIGLVIFIAGMLIFKLDKRLDTWGVVLWFLGAAVFLICFFGPLNGYEQPELVSEVELNSFYEQDGKKIYAIKLDYNQVAITYTEKEYVYGNEHELVHTEAIYAKIIEDKVCDIPIKQTYIKKPKNSIWSLGAGIKVQETIVVVPEGSVRK